jgi:hypothetical protein
MSTTGSGSNSHDDGGSEISKVPDKHDAAAKQNNRLQAGVDRNARQEFGKHEKDENNPENRLSRKTSGRGAFGECAIADVRFCGKNRDTAVELRNGLPERIQTSNQTWKRDLKNPRIWHIQEGHSRYDLQADVRLKDNELTAKVNYKNGREVTFKDGRAAEITHPHGEKWTADPRDPDIWQVSRPSKTDPVHPHHTQIREVKVNTADGSISWHVSDSAGMNHRREITSHGQFHDFKEGIQSGEEPAKNRLPDLQNQEQAQTGDSGADWLNKNNCSSATQSFWSEMCKAPKENYNCEFAVQAFVKRGTLHQSDDISFGPLKFHGNLHPASMTSGDSVRQTLKECGWQAHRDLSLDSVGHKSGEVVLLAGKEGPHAAMVGKVSKDGHILTLEQKPNPSDAPIVTTPEKFKSMYQPKEGAIDFFRTSEKNTERATEVESTRHFGSPDQAGAAEKARQAVEHIAAPSLAIPPRRQHESPPKNALPVVRGRFLQSEQDSAVHQEIAAESSSHAVPRGALLNRLADRGASAQSPEAQSVSRQRGPSLLMRTLPEERHTQAFGSDGTRSMQPTEKAHPREINTNSMLRALQNAYFVPKSFQSYARRAGQEQDGAIHTYNGQTLQQAGFHSYTSISRRLGD